MSIFDSLGSWVSANQNWIKPVATIGAGLIGQNQTNKAVEGIVNRTMPYSGSSMYGDTIFDDGAFALSPADNPFSTLLDQLGQAGLANYGATTQDPTQALDINTRNAMTSFTNDSRGAASGYFSALRDFDPNAAAASYTGTLDARAAPLEQRARMSNEDRLFQQGRLGTTGGGVQTEALLNSQNDAALGRTIAGRQYAGEEQNRIAGLAQGFGGAASTNAAATFQLGQGARQGFLNDSLAISGEQGNMFSRLLNQANVGISAGNAGATGASMLRDQAVKTGDLYANGIDQLIPALSKWLKEG